MPATDIQPAHEEEALGKAYDARLMRRLLQYLRPYRWKVVLGVAILLVTAGLELLGPYFTKVALDRAIPEGDMELLGLLGLLYLGALVFTFALSYGQQIITTWLGQRIMFDLRRQIFGHLQRQSLRYFDRNPVGRLMTRVTNDVEVLNQLFSSGIVTVFGDVFTLVFIVGVMLWMDWKLALVAFAVMPFVILVAFLFRAKVRAAYRDIRVRLARINAFLQERITGVSVVQIFGQEEETSEKFEAINRDHLEAHLRSITYYALFFPAIEILRLRPEEDADIPLPRYMSEHAAGMDICAAVSEPLPVDRGRIALIPTGLAVALPAGTEAQVRPRSGLAIKRGIGLINAPGTIDSDYRGEVRVPLINHDRSPQTIGHGERIAQMVVARVARIHWSPAERLPETARGSGGFGSTGR